MAEGVRWKTSPRRCSSGGGLGPTVPAPAPPKVIRVTTHTKSSHWTGLHRCAEMSCLAVAHSRDHKLAICCWQHLWFVLASFIVFCKMFKTNIHDKSRSVIHVCKACDEKNLLVQGQNFSGLPLGVQNFVNTLAGESPL